MKATKTLFILVVMCLASLSAGVVAGKFAGRGIPKPEPVRVEKAGLADELALSADQRDQMRRIWVKAKDRADDFAQEAQTAQAEQDRELSALLTAEQRTKFNSLTQKTTQRVADLESRRKHVVQDAVGQTEAILSESQRAAYREIVRSRLPTLPGTPDAVEQPAAK